MGQKLILITSGRARVTRDGRKIAELGPGDVVGEMSLIDARPRSASVVIFKSDFRRMLEDIPGLWEKLLVIQTARLRAADLGLEALG